MSRVIVKNLPAYVTKASLKEKFSGFGDTTEVRLLKNSKGGFRRIAYIGFSDDVAHSVIDALNGTFIDTCKISVETALPVGDSGLKRAWSKFSKESSAYIRNEIAERKRKKFINEFYDGKQKRQVESVDKFIIDSAKISEKDYELFRDFLQLHNAKIDLDSLEKPAEAGNETTPSTFYTVFLGNLRPNTTVLKILYFFKGLRVYDVRLISSVANKRSITAFVDFGDQETMTKALKYDGKTLKGTTVMVMPDKIPIKEKITHIVDRPQFDVLDTGRIFIRNLAFSTSEADIKQLFEKFGEISEINIPYDSKTHESYGLAYVSFMFPEHALQAMKEVDGTIFRGRVISVVASAEKYTHDIEATGLFKVDRANKLKNEAQANFMSWNSLFLNQNSVANLAARRLAVSKDSLLMSSSNPAVNIAAAETAIVNEIKTFLESKGVNLDAFRRTAKEKSDRVILVKNLPDGVTMNCLMDFMRERFNSLDPKIDLPSVIIPPHGITAILDFMDPKMASRAYKNLAYTKFKFVPLYLEWAPVGILTSCVRSGSMVHDTPKHVIHVKNLNQDTSEEYLRKKFAKFGDIIKISLSKKVPKASCGYGYIEYSKKTEAIEAAKKMQGKMIDGFELKIKLGDESNAKSKRIESSKICDAPPPPQEVPKLLVKNVPFEATLEDIHNLFSTYGEVKKVRLPKKIGSDSGHRGFAFVEFLSQEDANRCYEAMSLSTHLYGRRLVLEWAKDVTSIEGLRKRTITQYSQSDKTPKETYENIQEYLNKDP